ncbi:MAG: hypothetical protein LIO42_07615 [Oscillospiraceae bacterium]|nr:hypothetical protein [Oscillospiraceae bacterium]
MLYTVFISKGQCGPEYELFRLDGMNCLDAVTLARLVLVHGKSLDVVLRPELEEGDDD